MPNYGMLAGHMESQSVDSKVRSGLVTGLQDTDTIPNGAFVVADNSQAKPLPENVYGIGNISCENFKKFATGEKGAAYVCDSADIPEANVGGNTYRVDGTLIGMEFAKDKLLRFRKLEVEDRYYVFDGNIGSGTVKLGEYLIPTANSFFYTAQATQATSGFCVRVEAILPLNAGLRNLGSKYLVKVVQL